MLASFAEMELFRDEIVVIAYHYASDPWVDISQADHHGRYNAYEFTYIPHVFVDGVRDFTLSSTSLLATSHYVRKAIESPVAIELNVDISTGSLCIVNATVTSGDEAITENTKIRFALISKFYDGFRGANGLEEWHYDMLDMVPDHNGLDFTIDANSTQDVQVTFPLNYDLRGTAVDPSNMKAVVFIQNDATSEVLQAEWAELVTNSTSETSLENIPSEYSLNQNYPNPFNPETEISFSLPNNASVTITVFDVEGREVTKLIADKNYAAGNHSLTFNGSQLSSGIYFYNMSVNDGSTVSNFSKKMILLK